MFICLKTTRERAHQGLVLMEPSHMSSQVLFSRKGFATLVAGELLLDSCVASCVHPLQGGQEGDIHGEGGDRPRGGRGGAVRLAADLPVVRVVELLVDVHIAHFQPIFWDDIWNGNFWPVKTCIDWSRRWSLQLGDHR